MSTLLKSHYIRRIPLFLAVINIILTALLTSFAEPAKRPVAAPTDAEIFRSQGFEEPLVPIGGKTIASENVALQNAIIAYSKRTDRDDHSEMIRFLKDHPKSPWNAALLTNLGLEYRKTGWFLKALDAWEKAWALGKNEKSTSGKALMDRAVGELAELNARLGRRERVELILRETQNRPLIGVTTEKIAAAREGVWQMRHEPGNAFKCGPFALARIRASQGSDSAPEPKILAAQSTDHGMSLDQVWRLANDLGMDYQMAKRQPGSDIIVPSVVNWKANHYAALIRENHGRFLTQDPTFGPDLWVSKAALDAESSGYFLVPKGRLPRGWQVVDSKEASQVWGMGNTGDHDETGTKCIDDTVKSPCQGSCDGMATYNFHTQLVSLHITDTPVGYTPPIGPDMHFRLTYNQREASRGSGNFGYSNFGSKWVCDWVAYLTFSEFLSDGVTLNVPGGGSEFYPRQYFNGPFYPAFQSRAMLTTISQDPLRFARILSDGTTQIFDLKSDVGGGSSRFYMTQIVDPAGNAVHLTYDSGFRLKTVTDAAGNAPMEIGYVSNNINDGSNYYLIKTITDPFGRSASFDYDPDQNNQLVAIHDAVGITSRFAYATGSDSCGNPVNGTPSPCPADFIKSMTTPYGTTTFSQPASYLDAFSGPRTANARVIQAVDPTNAIERLEYGHSAPGISDAQSDVPIIPGTNILNASHEFRNSFYWDKKATAMYPPAHNDDPNCNCDVYDFTKAKLTQWLHTSGGDKTSNIKEREKMPLENAIYYFYADQGDTRFVGSSGLPTKVARVLDDGSTQLWQYQYNGVGKVRKVTDSATPARVTTYKYAGNNIDLTDVFQERPGGASTDDFGSQADLLAHYAYDPSDPPHLPHAYIDAAGQSTEYTYNSFGQITDILNAKRETTHYVYSDGTIDGVPNGYLASITSPTFNGSSAVTTFNYEISAGHFAPPNCPHTVTNAPDGYQVITDYDNLDRPTVITYPDGTTQQFEYSQDFGNGPSTILDLTATTDRDGRRTVRHYDANRHMDSITDALNQTTLYTWCACGSLEQMTDPGGMYPGDPDHTTTFNRDLQSRVISKVFPDSSATSYTYERTTSRLKSMVDANGQTTNYDYDGDDNLKRIAYPDALNATPSVGYIYDSYYNRVTSMTDGIGTTNYTYYPNVSGTLGAGKLYQVSGPFINDTITYRYDELGRVTGQDINGAASSVTYDSLGRVGATSNPLGGFTRAYEADVTPRLQTLNYPNGQTANYHYFGNIKDRRLQHLQNLTQSATNLSRHDYTYDPEGQIQTWNKTLGAVKTDQSLVYDDAKQLRTVTQPGITFSYDYDLTGNRLDAAFAGRGVHPLHGGNFFTANNLNQLDSIARNPGVGPQFTPVEITYDANGNMTYDGINQTYEWDAANRLIAIHYLDTGNRTEFAYDGLGRMRAIGVIKVESQGPDADFTAVITPGSAYYSSFGSGPLHLLGGSYSLSFQGLNPNGGDNTAFIDAVMLNNALVPNGGFETPTVHHSYAINLTGSTWHSDADAGVTDNGGPFTFANPTDAPEGNQVGFLHWNGTMSQTLSLTSGTYTLAFQAAQRAASQDTFQQFKVSLTPLGSNGGSLQMVSGKTFVWSGNRICEERDSTGSTTTKRFFAEGEQRVGGDDAGSYYYSRDHLGSIREVTNSNGDLVTQLDYGAWGNEVVVSGNMALDFGFTGHYFDQASGLNLARYRAYNPTLGRWISRDPLVDAELKEGMNLYWYAGDDPLNGVDPLGLTKIYGNWCGPDWTGGRKESFFVHRRGGFYEPPIDGLDADCLKHDICYYKCRRDHPCDPEARSQCFRACDRQLTQGAYAVGGFWADVIGKAIDRPGRRDPEPNSPSCSCGENK